mgnify:FL=1
MRTYLRCTPNLSTPSWETTNIIYDFLEWYCPREPHTRKERAPFDDTKTIWLNTEIAEVPHELSAECFAKHIVQCNVNVTGVFPQKLVNKKEFPEQRLIILWIMQMKKSYWKYYDKNLLQGKNSKQCVCLCLCLLVSIHVYMWQEYGCVRVCVSRECLFVSIHTSIHYFENNTNLVIHILQFTTKANLLNCLCFTWIHHSIIRSNKL